MKIAAAVGGGFARTGTVCGAISGGAMALGLQFGPTESGQKEKREKTYGQVQDMIRTFEKDFGSIQCRQLIGFNLLDPEERQKYRQSPLRPRCGEFIARVVDHVRGALGACGKEKQ